MCVRVIRCPQDLLNLISNIGYGAEGLNSMEYHPSIASIASFMIIALNCGFYVNDSRNMVTRVRPTLMNVLRYSHHHRSCFGHVPNCCHLEHKLMSNFYTGAPLEIIIIIIKWNLCAIDSCSVVTQCLDSHLNPMKCIKLCRYFAHSHCERRLIIHFY